LNENLKHRKMSVLVYIQNFEGKLKKQNLEVASYASKIATSIQSSSIAVIMGSIDGSELEKLGNYGIQKAYVIEGELFDVRINRIYSQAIEQVIKQENVSTLIFPDNSEGKALAPRLSVKLKAGFVSGVVSMPVSNDPFIIQKRVFSGKAFAQVKINSAIKIISLAINSFGLHEQKTSCEVVQFKPDISVEGNSLKLVDRKVDNEGVSLLDADRVVSGGRGMKGPENWHALEDLANSMGAAIACSRPVSDDGWRSHNEHVGQTGKIIAPNLYLAVGISGATQHIAGVSRSKCIVAINNDPDASVFEMADYGVLGDAMQVLPKLTEAFKSALGE